MKSTNEKQAGETTQEKSAQTAKPPNWPLVEQYGGERDIFPQYLRRRGAARYMAVSIGTLDEWIRRRVVPAIRPSARTVLLKRSDLDVALERFRVAAVGEGTASKSTMYPKKRWVTKFSSGATAGRGNQENGGITQYV